jgi:acyl-coenzyme A thioesterase PaaI-like protein
MFRASAWGRAGSRPSSAATSWRLDERSREERQVQLVTDFGLDPRRVDPEYNRHGGFPVFDSAHPGPGFARFLAATRRLQDLAVSANPSPDVWTAAADQVEKLVGELDPFEAAEGVGPANRVPDLPGAGSLLMPPWFVDKFEPDGVQLRVRFSRFHVGGNNAVHGGVLPLLFDSLFGMIIHAAGQPISRTAFLHVDYRKVTPIETELIATGWIREAEGRKAFVNAELRDPDGNLLAEANGLMVRLLPGQP